jgi:hypothetical protein
MLLCRRPLEWGSVIDLRIFQFTLLEIGGWVAADQSTGCILHIPNGKVFRDVLATFTPTVYTRLESSGVRLTVRYLCEPRQRRSSAQAIWEDVLRTVADHADIEFAYPTQRFYDRRLESSQERVDSPDRPESA